MPNHKPNEPAESAERPLTSDTKLAIRDEVELRVEKLERKYWVFGGVIGALIAAFCVLLWNKQISEVGNQVAKELAEKKVVQARDRILSLQAEPESRISSVAR